MTPRLSFFAAVPRHYFHSEFWEFLICPKRRDVRAGRCLFSRGLLNQNSSNCAQVLQSRLFGKWIAMLDLLVCSSPKVFLLLCHLPTPCMAQLHGLHFQFHERAMAWSLHNSLFRSSERRSRHFQMPIFCFPRLCEVWETRIQAYPIHSIDDEASPKLCNLCHAEAAAPFRRRCFGAFQVANPLAAYLAKKAPRTEDKILFKEYSEIQAKFLDNYADFLKKVILVIAWRLGSYVKPLYIYIQTLLSFCRSSSNRYDSECFPQCKGLLFHCWRHGLLFHRLLMSETVWSRLIHVNVMRPIIGSTASRSEIG